MEMGVRVITSAEAVNRVLQWRSLARDGGRKQGIAVEIPGKRRSTASVVQKTEGTSLSKLLILVEAGVRPCRLVVKGKQKIAANP